MAQQLVTFTVCDKNWLKFGLQLFDSVMCFVTMAEITQERNLSLRETGPLRNAAAAVKNKENRKIAAIQSCKHDRSISCHVRQLPAQREKKRAKKQTQNTKGEASEMRARKSLLLNHRAVASQSAMCGLFWFI